MVSPAETPPVVVVGAGAAGLATAIFARQISPARRVLLLDGAARPGAKILVSGGSRCNVTNTVVTEADYWGGKRTVIRRVLRRLPVGDTVAFFERIGVPLKEEPNGKLFPRSDRSRDVLDALLRAAVDARVQFEGNAEAAGQVVGGAERQDAEGQSRLQQAGDGGIQGAVATADHHAIETTHRRAGDDRLRAGHGVWPFEELRVQAGFGQHPERRLGLFRAAARLAVDDEERTPALSRFGGDRPDSGLLRRCNRRTRRGLRQDE
jgi:hypothetical protein